MASYPGTAYMNSIATYPTDYNSPSPSSPRRDSAVSTNKMHRTHGSRSSSRSSRRHSSYDRPTRTQGPRRTYSAPYGQLPQVNVEAAIAFHERSCALFRNASTAPYPSSTSYPPTATYASTTTYPSAAAYPSATAYPSTNVPLSSSPPHEEYPFPPSATESPDTWAEELDAIDEKFTLDDEEGSGSGGSGDGIAAPATTEIRWTSDETRRREYAEIDRAHSGFKGLLRRVFPKIAARSNKSRFYSEDEGSDAGSVRRYRLDLDGGEQEEY